MDELNAVFNSPRPMTDATKTDHINTFNKLNKLYVIDRPLHQFTFKMITDILTNPTLSPSYQRKMINLFIVIKATITPTADDLPKLRELSREVSKLIDAKRVVDFETKTTDLYDTIAEWINSLDIDAEPIKYIVNFIVFYLNTRNLDLYVKVIDADETMADDTINYLVIYPTHIRYIRNTYKTSNRYDTKVVDITDPRFIYAVSKLKNNNMFLPNTDGYLLSKNKTSLNNMISRRLYNNMNETDYLHQNITKFEGDTNKLFIIENNRGTNIRTLLTNYNKSFNGK